ncbi:MAG: ribosome silencing factor [Phycisphaera sp.]|nr:ribosome silencing factor [Phycisphaera sp.]
MSTDHPAPRSADTPADPERFVCHVARLLADSNCEGVVALDLRGISQVTDFFIIGSGTSDRQIRSVVDDLKKLARESGEAVAGTSGEDSAQWMVIDLFSVVVHLFEPQLRAYYDLESLWADGKKVDWQSRTKPGQFARL